MIQLSFTKKAVIACALCALVTTAYSTVNPYQAVYDYTDKKTSLDALKQSIQSATTNDLLEKKEEYDNVLEMAIHLNLPEASKALLERTDVETLLKAKGSNDETPLMYAIENMKETTANPKNSRAIVLQIIQASSSENLHEVNNIGGNAALHIAATMGLDEPTQAIIKKDPSLLEQEGWAKMTPLPLAIFSYHAFTQMEEGKLPYPGIIENLKKNIALLIKQHAVHGVPLQTIETKQIPSEAVEGYKLEKKLTKASYTPREFARALELNAIVELFPKPQKVLMGLPKALDSLAHALDVLARASKRSA